jgi:ERCC4-type nuclease
MIVLIDTREQLPYQFTRYQGVTTERATLPTGDYSLLDFESCIAIERKSINDLIGCLMGDNRTRFEKELSRARSYECFAVVVEGTIDDMRQGRYRSEMKPHAALQSIVAFHVRYGTAFLWAGSRQGGEYLVHSILTKYAAEIEKRFERLSKHSGG